MQGSFNEPRKRKILFIITQSELGGAQQFLIQLASHLNKLSWDFSIATGSDGDGGLAASITPDKPIITAIHLKRNPDLINDLKAVWELRTIILRESPDLVFLMSSKAGFVGSLAAKLAKMSLPNIKIIYRIGGWTFNDPWPAWKKRLYRLLEKITAGLKDVIVVNSARDLKDAEKFNIRAREETLLIHNGVDPYRELMSREEAQIRLFDAALKSPLAKENGVGQSLFHSKAIVGTIANFYPAKDLKNFVAAVGSLPEGIIGIIIGDGPLRIDIETQIREEGLAKKIFLTGRLDNAYQFLPSFDVFALASVKEGFPWAVIEAMAAKVPVISTPVGAVPEVITDGQNGLIAPIQSPIVLASLIRKLMEDDRLRQELAINGHQTILSSFSLRTMLEKYEALFERLT